MKERGIIRSVDKLGRIVIPMEMRRSLGISVGDPIEITASFNSITLSPSKLRCAVCGDCNEKSLVEHSGISLCRHCIETYSRKGGA